MPHKSDYQGTPQNRTPPIVTLSATRHVNVLVTESVRASSATYNEFLAPTGGGNSVIVHLDGPEGLHVVWLLARVGKPDDWSSDQMVRIVSLLPHVRHFVRVRQALAGADTSRVRSMLDLLLNGRMGVFLLDRWGTSSKPTIAPVRYCARTMA